MRRWIGRNRAGCNYIWSLGVAATLNSGGAIDEHQSYEQAANSPNGELRIFTPEEGATEHVGLDHLPHVGAYTADWIEDRFDELA